MHGVMTRRRGPPASAGKSRFSASTRILVPSDKSCSARQARTEAVIAFVGLQPLHVRERLGDEWNGPWDSLRRCVGQPGWRSGSACPAALDDDDTWRGSVTSMTVRVVAGGSAGEFDDLVSE